LSQAAGTGCLLRLILLASSWQDRRSWLTELRSSTMWVGFTHQPLWHKCEPSRRSKGPHSRKLSRSMPLRGQSRNHAAARERKVMWSPPL
jgi:hypothetical protein